MKITDTLLYEIILSSSDKTKNYCRPLLGKNYSIFEFKSKFQCCYFNFELCILTGGDKSQGCKPAIDSTEIGTAGQSR